MSLLKSYHNAGPNGQRAWTAIRRFVPKQIRTFYEGCPAIPGQLWYRERKVLYRTIRQFQPRTVFEVGTWYGGGSTFFIAQALHDNGGGLLYTMEPNEIAYENAVAGYRRELPHLLPYVKFLCGRSTDIFPQELINLQKLDALFLDGAQDSRQTSGEFAMFEPYLSPGSIFMAHDWDNEKMESVRPRMEQSRDWVLETQLTAPHSLGFVVYRKLPRVPNSSLLSNS
jgi:predicted O-methyltransferase YrrM